LVEY
jgi:hypothetical protein